MIPALGPQTIFFWQLRYPGLGILATGGEKKHRDACRSSAAATEHDQQALRPLHDAMQTIVT